MPVDKFGGNASSAIAGAAAQFSTVGLVHKNGDTMLGILSAGGFRIIDVGAPTTSSDGATKAYADMVTSVVAAASVLKAGDTMTGVLDMSGNAITGLPPPANAPDAASKNYVDTAGGTKRSATGEFPSTVNANLVLATFPAGKTVVNGKIRDIQLLVERNPDEWFDATCSKVGYDWGGQLYSYSNVGGTKWYLRFTVLAVSLSWTRNYKLTWTEMP